MSRKLVDLGELARSVKSQVTDPQRVWTELGLAAGPGTWKRQPRGGMGRCPAHEDKTPSCSVQVRDSVLVWNCFSCSAGGDLLAAYAARHGLSTRRDFRDVIAGVASLFNVISVIDALDGRAAEQPRAVAPVRVATPAKEERRYPPQPEVDAVLASTVDVAADDQASAMLNGRGLDVARVDDDRLARVVPPTTQLPSWARFAGRSWLESGHRVVLPVVDAEGNVRSLRAWRVRDDESPKRLMPGGHRASGLVLADAFAVAMLRGTWTPTKVIIVEGEPDFLAACSHAWGHVLAARLGIFSGSWTDELAEKVPSGAEVAIWTDDDRAGEDYAKTIASSLVGRCRVVRGAGGLAS